MVAQELRIGNLIEQGVIEIMSENAVWINEKLLLIDEIQSIPLTEEWLVKFGFEKSKYEYFTKFAGNNVMTIFIFQERIKVDIVNQFICNIHYVHQLQNLYFALTKKELTL